MSQHLLQWIAAGPLPYVAETPAEIHEIAVMRAAGLVDAFVPNRGDEGYLTHATVLRITDEGRALVRQARGPAQISRPA